MFKNSFHLQKVKINFLVELFVLKNESQMKKQLNPTQWKIQSILMAEFTKLKYERRGKGNIKT